MTYIPKNKIQTDLYTSGGDFIYVDSKVNYIGYYHKLYNGKYYTGKTPNDTIIKEIISLEKTIDSGIDIVNPTPVYSPILPTEQDYNLGEFIRYFSIKRNQSIFTEISKNNYNQFKAKDPQVSWESYRVFSLVWKLKGDKNTVAKVNYSITKLTEAKEKVFGLGLYLKENWIQYYKS